MNLGLQKRLALQLVWWLQGQQHLGFQKRLGLQLAWWLQGQRHLGFQIGWQLEKHKRVYQKMQGYFLMLEQQ